jgi:hypothetical protein
VTLRLLVLWAGPGHGSVFVLVMHHDAHVLQLILMPPLVRVRLRVLEAAPVPLRRLIRLALRVVLEAEAVVVAG